MTQGPCQPLHTVCWHGLPQSALVCQQVIWRHSANDLRGRILAPGHVPEALAKAPSAGLAPGFSPRAPLFWAGAASAPGPLAHPPAARSQVGHGLSLSLHSPFYKMGLMRVPAPRVKFVSVQDLAQKTGQYMPTPASYFYSPCPSFLKLTWAPSFVGAMVPLRP